MIVERTIECYREEWNTRTGGEGKRRRGEGEEEKEKEKRRKAGRWKVGRQVERT